MTRSVANALNPFRYLPESCKISDVTQRKVGRAFSYVMERYEAILIIGGSLLLGACLVGAIPLHYVLISALVFSVLGMVCKPYVDKVRDGVKSSFFTNPRMEIVKPAADLSEAVYMDAVADLCDSKRDGLSSDA